MIRLPSGSDASANEFDAEQVQDPFNRLRAPFTLPVNKLPTQPSKWWLGSPQHRVKRTHTHDSFCLKSLCMDPKNI